jgi:hypothetical protein
LNQSYRNTHLWAAVLFAGLAVAAVLLDRTAPGGRWLIFAVFSFGVAILAWIRHGRALRRKHDEQPDQITAYPEGQARLIDSGRLPNRYNPRIDLREYEFCHFTVAAQRVLFAPLPSGLNVDPTRLVVRFSGGAFYFIVRPQEILLPAEPDEQVIGELAITNQRIIFLATENGFEIPLQSLKMLDCSAHLVDFQVRDRRYTLQTDAACYAEKVLLLLLQPPSG